MLVLGGTILISQIAVPEMHLAASAVLDLYLCRAFLE